MTENLSPYYDFMVETAYLAGKITLGYFQAGVTADYKPDDTPVTAADRAVEQFIRGRIEKRFPGHAIVGEEFGQAGGDVTIAHSDHRWIIDPIDGTKAFLRGVPLYGVLIGLEIEGKIEVGAAYFPALDDLVSAATGLGCWWNGRRTHVSAEARLDRATVTITDPGGFYKFNRGPAWERLMRAVYHRAGWSDAYGYFLVATGRVEICLDPAMAIWDCGPFPPIFAEAGGFFGNWHGRPGHTYNEALACNQALLPAVLDVLNGSGGRKPANV